jgi:hypothetical protein
MKHLKTYRMFESSVELTPEQIEWLDKCTNGNGTWQLNPQTGEVDVEGDFGCNMQGLSDFNGVRFGRVKGDFHCSDNQLTTLVGAPQDAGRGFYCDYNQLTTLEGAPQKVKGDFDCENNQLTSLEGAPREVGGSFYCRDNQLTSLEGAPQEVRGDFRGHKNQLTSLEGAPQEVGGDFICYHNPVANETLKRIFGIMKKGKSYLKAVESLWMKIPLEDQTLLYRPEFEWIGPDEVRKLDALRAYQGFKGMI